MKTITAPPGTDIVLGVSTYPAAATGGWLFELGTLSPEPIALLRDRGGTAGGYCLSYMAVEAHPAGAGRLRSHSMTARVASRSSSL